jgi:hypothetical protein
MDKRLAKRHKRAVARAREHAKISEPDVRTPEEIKAAREASRGHGFGASSGHAKGSMPSLPGSSHPPVTGSASKTDA